MATWIDSRQNVPEVFLSSRDYHVFLRLLDLMLNDEKSDVDNLVGGLNADKCPSELLPLLASYVGYEYDHSLTYDTNRMIIKYYPEMLRLKGSEKGLALACAIAFQSAGFLDSIQDAMKYINIVKDTNDPNTIFVYLGFSTIVPKLFDLIEAVRPIGMSIQIKPSNSVRVADEIRLSDVATASHGVVVTYNRNKVMDADGQDDATNYVGAGEVTDDGQ